MGRVHGDGGQMMAALCIGLAVTLLAFCVVALVPIGAATNEVSQSRTAADAAALAGAQAVRERWVDFETRPGRLGFVHPGIGDGAGLGIGLGLGGRGRSEAETLAERNGADLISYSLPPGSSEVRVEVRNRNTSYPDGPRAESSATAALDIDLDDCRWSLRPPEPVYEAGGEPTFEATLTCGGWSADYVVSNAVATAFQVLDYDGSSNRDRSYRDLEPYLVD